jgi:diguanylate cyclase (GGDEF)-like protein
MGNTAISERSDLADKGSIFDIDDYHFMYIRLPFNEITEDEKMVLCAVVEHLKVAQEWRTSLEKGFEIQRRLDMLHKITTAIRGTLNLSEVLARTARDLGQTLGVSRCFIRRYDPNIPGKVLATEEEYTEHGLMKASDTIFDFETDWMKALSKSVERVINDSDETLDENILFLSNVEELPDPDGVWLPLIQMLELKTFLGVPLMYQGMVVGSLCFHQCKRVREFDTNEFEFIRQVAAEASVAIIHAEMYKHIQLQAKTDSLTGLHNKAAFNETLTNEIERAKRTHGELSVMMIDMDFLKTANDNFGHIIGDEMIKLMGSKLKQMLRQIDIIARFGGDEFGVILPETSLSGAKQLAIRLAEEIKLTKHPIVGNLSASIGVAGSPLTELEPKILVDDADKALYLAKKRGKGQAASADDEEFTNLESKPES